jgi:hypothetical protein
MPRCPQCGKKFQDNMRIQAHLNSRSTSCRTHFDELVSISEVLRRGHGTQHPQVELHAVSGEDSDLTALSNDGALGVGDDDRMDVDNPGAPHAGDGPYHIEKHPSASQTYGRGCSFMDMFDQDEHADKRSHHLYYPFASRDEWEIASFLLQSGLSMAQIDKLLNLQLVCHSFYYYAPPSDQTFRLENSTYLFRPQQTFAVMQRSYRQGLSRRPSPLQGFTLPRAKLIYSTGILYSACSR